MKGVLIFCILGISQVMRKIINFKENLIVSCFGYLKYSKINSLATTSGGISWTYPSYKEKFVSLQVWFSFLKFWRIFFKKNRESRSSYNNLYLFLPSYFFSRMFRLTYKISLIWIYFFVVLEIFFLLIYVLFLYFSFIVSIVFLLFL